MTRTRTLVGCTILAVCLAAPGGFAWAQQSGGGLLGNLFNGGNRQVQSQPVQPPGNVGGQGGNGVDARVDQLESALRHLTGQVQELQHQTQMLQMQLNRMQGGGAYRSPPTNGGGGNGPAHDNMQGNQSETQPPAQSPQNQSAAAISGGQGDAFNPALHPNAPGVPRALGSGQPMQGGMASSPGSGMNGPMGNNAPPGTPGGGQTGAPLNLNALSGMQPPNAAAEGGGTPVSSGNMEGGGMSGDRLPAPLPRNPSATGTQLATLPPNSSPKDVYELGYGYVLHRNYGLAAQAFRYFLRKYPNDPRAADADYWLGESLFLQHQYGDAARAFLTVSTKYKNFSRAPDALLRLGQSLAALHHKEAACATLGEVKNKFPHASVSVKRGVERELKRVHC